MSRDKQIEEMADEIKIAHDEQKYLTSDKSIKAIAKHLYNSGYRKSTDLAEEIFAEIEEIVAKEIHRCDSMRAKEKDATERIYWEGGRHSLQQARYWLAELKKKYIGKDINVRTKESEDTE